MLLCHVGTLRGKLEMCWVFFILLSETPMGWVLRVPYSWQMHRLSHREVKPRTHAQRGRADTGSDAKVSGGVTLQSVLRPRSLPSGGSWACWVDVIQTEETL